MTQLCDLAVSVPLQQPERQKNLVSILSSEKCKFFTLKWVNVVFRILRNQFHLRGKKNAKPTAINETSLMYALRNLLGFGNALKLKYSEELEKRL